MRCSSAASRPSSARRKSSGICSIRPTRPTSIPAGVGTVREREQEEAARGRDPHHPPGAGRGRARRRVPARRGAADARARGERPAAPGRLGRARPRLSPRRPHRSPDPAVAADALARGERLGQGILVGWAAGLVLPGGPYVFFPVVANLFRNGAEPGPLIALLTAKTLVSPVRMLTYEAPLLGWP